MVHDDKWRAVFLGQLKQYLLVHSLWSAAYMFAFIALLRRAGCVIASPTNSRHVAQEFKCRLLP